jgi:hypothetical protein
MKMSRLFAIVALGASLAACGGNDFKEEDCIAGLKYQNRAVAKRVVVPDGLDPLDDLREMPIPKADPEAASPPPGQCVDAPPSIRLGS